MAQIISTRIKAHSNIYTGTTPNYDERDMLTKWSIPDQTNENTGIFVIISGYGGCIDSNIFKKMRREFPEMYNLCVVQCEYFGIKAIGPPKIELFSNNDRTDKSGPVLMDESIDEFSDMGIMQAADVVNATLTCIKYLSENKLKFNNKKVILFGTSHGAYICHLANLICPRLYTWLIDNCSYVKPYYLNHLRSFSPITKDKGKRVVQFISYLQLHPEIKYSEVLYDLSFLYKHAYNFCNVVSFIGKDDGMVNYKDKIKLIDIIGDKARPMLIGKEDIDGQLCKHTGHGLGLDFMILFETLMPMITKNVETGNKGMPELDNIVIIGDEDNNIQVGYYNNLPYINSISGLNE